MPELAPATPFLGGGLPVDALGPLLREAAAAVQQVANADLPDSPRPLAECYGTLGRAVTQAETVLLGALDALDPKTGGGIARPSEPYSALKEQAFQTLRAASAQLERLTPAFDAVVHDNNGWSARKVPIAADRGDGRPLFVYENTFKKDHPLPLADQKAEYDGRVAKYLAGGGRFEDIITATPAALAGLSAEIPYDFALPENGPLRLSPNPRDGDGAAKPGHSLLAEGGPEYHGGRVLVAGEMVALKDSAGDLEALLVANNSGHFKPEAADLENLVPTLEKLGVPREKIVLVGGPNNIPAILDEMSEKFSDPAMLELTPPTSRALLAKIWREQGCLG